MSSPFRLLVCAFNALAVLGLLLSCLGRQTGEQSINISKVVNFLPAERSL